MTASELPLNLGRVLGIILFLLAVPYLHNRVVLGCLMLILGAAPALGWVFVRRMVEAQESQR
jgi:hypothetical protein